MFKRQGVICVFKHQWKSEIALAALDYENWKEEFFDIECTGLSCLMMFSVDDLDSEVSSFYRHFRQHKISSKFDRALSKNWYRFPKMKSDQLIELIMQYRKEKEKILAQKCQ
ncbi:hypothetical protein [Sporosarcina koreensis]|uniref:hypothetical protein n=1 Tax=Sporosarcina koreensis TaxID=334735 RepID=UPI000590210D|nr:hypothetical protein [Sporosarcina koreensis]